MVGAFFIFFRCYQVRFCQSWHLWHRSSETEAAASKQLVLDHQFPQGTVPSSIACSAVQCSADSGGMQQPCQTTKLRSSQHPPSIATLLLLTNPLFSCRHPSIAELRSEPAIYGSSCLESTTVLRSGQPLRACVRTVLAVPHPLCCMFYYIYI